jgi:hypothetical protein
MTVKTSEDIRTKYVQIKYSYYGLWMQIDTVLIKDEVIYTFPH